MKLQSLNPKKVKTYKQKIEAIIKDGFCPVCKEKLVEQWNIPHTHKYQTCPIINQHHIILVDYEKDDD